MTQAQDANPKERDVLAIKNLPLSRRELLRRMTRDAPKTAARALAKESDADPKTKTTPRERQRLIEALSKAQTLNREARITGLSAIRLGASEKCTACGVCARLCPTGAIKFSTTEQNEYRLELLISACTDCGVCADVCEPAALYRECAPSAVEFIAAEPVVLRAGELKECSRCGAKFAAHLEGNLCSICSYRQNNPFGSRLPPAVAAHLQKKRAAAK